LISLITWFVWIIIAVIVLFISVNACRKLVTSSVGKERDELHCKIDELNKKIVREVDAAESMTSTEELENLKKNLEDLSSQIEQEKQKLAKNEETIKKLQEEIDGKELRHNELKVLQEDKQLTIETIKDKKELISGEAKQLETQLSDSKTSILNLLEELNLNEQQLEILNKLSTSLADSTSILSELTTVYNEASERFIKLKNQHIEMEKEYKNLVEKQLSGS
jgi:chromosome segregation ATPase